MSDEGIQLGHIDLFAEVEKDILEELVGYMQPKFYAKGTLLFKRHDPGNTMYIIREGRIRLYIHDHDGHEITLMYHNKNEIFGELSLIDQRTRSASASAAEDLEVLLLERSDFLKFLNKHPKFGIAMMRSLSLRLRTAASYLQEYHTLRDDEPVREQEKEPSDVTETVDLSVQNTSDENSILSSKHMIDRLKSNHMDRDKDSETKSPSVTSKITGVFAHISSRLGDPSDTAKDAEDDLENNKLVP